MNLTKRLEALEAAAHIHCRSGTPRVRTQEQIDALARFGLTEAVNAAEAVLLKYGMPELTEGQSRWV